MACRSRSLARTQARRMAWHSMAMRACRTSSRMLGSGARQSVSAWPRTEASAERT